MDAEVAERAGGEQARDLVRHRADAELQRRAVLDERGGVRGDGDLLGRRRLGREHDEVVRRARPRRRPRRRGCGCRRARGARPTRGMRAFTSAMASRSGSRAASRNGTIGRAGVRPEAEPAVGVGRRRDRQHDARPQPQREALEAVEVDGEELDARHPSPAPCARWARRRRSATRTCGFCRKRVRLDEQARVEDDVLEIVARRRARRGGPPAVRSRSRTRRCRAGGRAPPRRPSARRCALRRHGVGPPRTARRRRARPRFA